jgi:hypothetical protein
MLFNFRDRTLKLTDRGAIELFNKFAHNVLHLFQVVDKAEGDNWHYAHFCVMNQGGIRAAIPSGSKFFNGLSVLSASNIPFLVISGYWSIILRASFTIYL